MAKSRVEYFRKLNEKYKFFSARLERDKLAKFDKWITDHNMNRVSWLNKVVDDILANEETK